MTNQKKKTSTDKKNLPYFKFYPTDFLLGIAYMTNAEIGAYIKLLCYQWNKGYLPNDMTILEKLSGGMTDNVLDKFIKTDKGWINERLEKERMAYLDKCEKNSKSINCRWSKHDTNVIRTYNERTTNVIPSQKSEVRSQNIEDRKQKSEDNNLESILSIWNDFAKARNLSAIIKLSEKRKTGILQRSKEKEFDLQAILDRIDASDFLLGNTKEGWKVDFDWIFCSANNYLKIIEGKYENTKGVKDERIGGIKKSELSNFINKERS
jgi:uncharacterized protein YdaU (DUF1376 family)